MSTTDGAVWPDEPVPAGVQPAPRADSTDSGTNGGTNSAGSADATALRAAADDAQDRLRRAVADLDNQRKRCARQLAEERAAGRSETAALWLPVVDNLDRALESAARAGAMDPMVDGVRAVRDQAVALLDRLGFPRHGEVKVPFDPRRHEAVGVTHDVVAEPGTVVQVVRPGYGHGDRQLRPAAVVVAGQRG